MADQSLSVKVYDQEYFSGAQCCLYIGDVLIDEITGLQIEVSQKKMPIYGYASQLFDKVAKGTVLVQGSFTINFKEAGYLNTVLRRNKHKLNGFSAGRNTPFISPDGLSMGERTGGARQNGQLGFVSRQNIEQLVQRGMSGKDKNGDKIPVEERIEFFRSLSGFNNDFTDGNPKKTPGSLPPVESIFESFEDKIWGSDPLTSDEEGRRGDSNIFDDFTIFITFGDYNRNDRVNHTAKRLDNVHILGQGQAVQINGEPVGEQFNFIARNFV